MTEFVTAFVEHARSELYDDIDLHPGKFWNGDAETIICNFFYTTFLVKKLWPKVIVLHSPQATHFRSLVETVREHSRSAVLAMFEEYRFTGCYNKYLTDNHRSEIPTPDPSVYLYLKHEKGILPPNYYKVVSQYRNSISCYVN